jgi:hypothetical protein
VLRLASLLNLADVIWRSGTIPRYRRDYWLYPKIRIFAGGLVLALPI